jgi:hypothetical protein
MRPTGERCEKAEDVEVASSYCRVRRSIRHEVEWIWTEALCRMCSQAGSQAGSLRRKRVRHMAEAKRLELWRASLLGLYAVTRFVHRLAHASFYQG